MAEVRLRNVSEKKEATDDDVDALLSKSSDSCDKQNLSAAESSDHVSSSISSFKISSK